MLNLTNFESFQILFGILSFIVAIITIIILFKRNLQTEEQIKQTQKQINLQDLTRKDQQFLDAIKLIEDNPNEPKFGGLNILENLERTDENYKQRILEYLGTYTIKLKSIVENLKLEFEEELIYPDRTYEDSRIEKEKELEYLYPYEFKVDYSAYTKEINLFTAFKQINIKFKINNIQKFNVNSSLDKILINNKEFEFKNTLDFENLKISIIFDNSIEQDFEGNFYQKIKFRLSIDNYQLRLNFHEYIQKEFKFEYECLKLAEKIINTKNKKSRNFLQINLSNLFLPFLNLKEKNEFDIQLNDFPNNNLIGLNVESSFLELKSICNYSTFNKLHNKIDFFNQRLETPIKNIEIIDCEISVGGAFENSIFEIVRFYYKETTSSYFNKCNFKHLCFFKSIKGKAMLELYFKECYLEKKIEFINMRINFLKFENCKFNSNLDLSKITIINQNKQEIEEMKGNFKQIEIENNIKVKLPKFEKV
ncbi:MAG: hypothetical protein LAT82_04740 [Nanoarchaeota archaeon]|nr:hypothetical protein [Nanoarchaeota archaeon]